MMRSLALTLLAGCSSILGIEDLSGPAAPVDARPEPADVIVGNVITYSLEILLFDPTTGDQPLAGAPVEFVRMPDRAVIEAQLTAPDGRVSFTLPTGGMALDGYVRVLPDPQTLKYPETAFYPPPLVASVSQLMQVVTDPVLDQFAQSVGEQRDPSFAFVFVFVTAPDSNGSDMLGRAGIRIDSNFGEKVIYTDEAGQPQPMTLQQTSSTGQAFIVNAVPAPHDLRAFDNTVPGGGQVGARVVDIQAARTAHFVIIPTQ